jgi:hypothetical protein
MPGGDHDFRIHRGVLRGISSGCQKFASLLNSALPEPQLGEATKRLNARLAAEISGHGQRAQQLSLRSGPVLCIDQDSAVMGPAPCMQERAAVLHREAVGRSAPVGGSFVVGDQAARRQHAAAGPNHGVKARAFAG